MSGRGLSGSRAGRILTLGMLDLRLATRDKPALFWMVLLPVALMWVFGRAMSGGGERARPQAEIAVVTEDDGFLAPLYLEALAREGVAIRAISEAQADSAAAASTVLRIPAGFTASVLAARPVELPLEPPRDSNTRLGPLAEIRIWEAVIGFLTTLRVTERELGTRVAGGGAGTDSLLVSARYREVAARARAVSVIAADGAAGSPVPSGFGHSVPAVLTQSVLMMTVIYGAVFLAMEKVDGALRRQGTLPVSRGDIVLGKLLGRFLLAAAQIAVLVAVATLFYGARWGRDPGGLLVALAAFALCCAALGLLGGAIFRTPEQAGALGWIAPLVMAALGGCWWPLEIVPRGMQLAGHVSPAAWAMDAFHGLITYGGTLGDIVVPVLALLAFTAAATAAAARWLRWD